MQTYNPPLRDMRFVLHELHDSAALAKLPGLEEMTPDLLNTVLEEAGKFITCDAAAAERQRRCRGLPLRRWRGAHAEGIPGRRTRPSSTAAGARSVPIPSTAAKGCRKASAKLVEEMICACNLSFGLYPGLSHGAYLALKSHGSDALKNLYLPKLVDGSWTGTMCLTEAHCGTDLGLLRTKAVPQADGSYQHHRLEDFHLGRRARSHGEHHPLGARAHAGCAARRQGHQSVRRAQVSAERRWQRGRAQRRQVHGHRAQDGHQGVRDLPDHLR